MWVYYIVAHVAECTVLVECAAMRQRRTIWYYISVINYNDDSIFVLPIEYIVVVKRRIGTIHLAHTERTRRGAPFVYSKLEGKLRRNIADYMLYVFYIYIYIVSSCFIYVYTEIKWFSRAREHMPERSLPVLKTLFLFLFWSFYVCRQRTSLWKMWEQLCTDIVRIFNKSMYIMAGQL